MKKLFLTISASLFLAILVQAQTWHTDLDSAFTIAKDAPKKVVLVFSGSDWCAPCIKLKKNILESEAFKAYSKEHFTLVNADFPRKKQNRLSKDQQQKNNALAEKYNPQGHFPLVVVFDPDGNVLGKTGYKNVAPKEYIDLLEGF